MLCMDFDEFKFITGEIVKYFAPPQKNFLKNKNLCYSLLSPRGIDKKLGPKIHL